MNIVDYLATLNIVDYVILAIIGVSVIMGMYRGFVSGVLNLISLLGALLIAHLTYPQLAEVLQGNESLIRTLMYYTDAGSRITDVELAMTPVSNLSSDTLTSILQSANLPEVFQQFVRSNVSSQVFAGAGSSNISEYLNQTIIAVSLNIICFLLCFLLAYLVLTMLGNLICYVFRLPVLRHLDALMGGVFGGVRGVFLVFVIFALVPIILTVSPIEQVGDLIEQSKLAGYFYKTNLIAAIMRGYV